MTIHNNEYDPAGIVEREKRERLTEIRLSGITTEPEFQCAYLSVPHAVKNREVFLVWGSPDGDLQLGVSLKAGIVRIRKVE